MTDEPHRRHSDVMLADFDKRLALVEQAQGLHAKASDARWETVHESLKSLATEVRNTLSLLQTVIAEPSASPAGRQLVTDLAELSKNHKELADEVDDHDDFINEVKGAIRLARFALGTSLLSALGTGLMILQNLQKSSN